MEIFNEEKKKKKGKNDCSRYYLCIITFAFVTYKRNLKFYFNSFNDQRCFTSTRIVIK